MGVRKELTWLDYLLAGLCAVLAAYSGGMGARVPEVASFFVVAISIATVVGFVSGKLLRRTRYANLDGYLLFFGVIAVTVQLLRLNEMLPEGGYGRQLIIGSLLSFILLIGSLFAWRDQTQIFLAVPCIALFGLVGVWGTFEGVIPLFFVFLLGIATLFARANMRMLMRTAEASGQCQVERLREGPWRWVAGPEWALVSAGIIIFISYLGAPILQESVKGVTSAVRLNIQLPQPPNNPIPPQNFGIQQRTMAIGQGPRSLREIPVARVMVDEPRYLRGRTFTVYTGRAWANVQATRWNAQGTESNVVPVEIGGLRRPYDPRSIIKDGQEIPFELKIDYGNHERVYFPGEVMRVQGGPATGSVLRDGNLLSGFTIVPGTTINGTALVAPDDAQPRNAGEPPVIGGEMLANFTDTRTVHPEVRDLAERLVQGATSDYERAVRIKEGIESRVRYNLEAAAVPSDVEPVYHFLFRGREGYCDLFASAMVQMARVAGLPARMATGFLINNPERDRDGYFVVRDSDYHAWAEIFFEDVGWVVFDATEGAPFVPGLGRGDVPREQKPWFETPAARTALDVAIGVTVLVLLLIVGRGYLKRNPRTARPIRTDIGRVYARFQREVERRTGVPRRLATTPRQYVAEVGEKLGEAQAPAWALTEQFERALYSPKEPDEAELKSLATAVRSFRALPKG